MALQTQELQIILDNWLRWALSCISTYNFSEHLQVLVQGLRWICICYTTSSLLVLHTKYNFFFLKSNKWAMQNIVECTYEKVWGAVFLQERM